VSVEVGAEEVEIVGPTLDRTQANGGDLSLLALRKTAVKSWETNVYSVGPEQMLHAVICKRLCCPLDGSHAGPCRKS
jgi:hypothetical protein